MQVIIFFFKKIRYIGHVRPTCLESKQVIIKILRFIFYIKKYLNYPQSIINKNLNSEIIYKQQIISNLTL